MTSSLQATERGTAPGSARVSLRAARVARFLSAYALARRAHLSASTILDIENGARPRLATIARLAEALGMSAHAIAWPGNPLGDRDEDGDE